MTDTEIREAHACLMDVYEKVQQEFSGLDEEILQDIYFPEQIKEVRKYGDGHTLWAVPSDIDEMMSMMSDTDLVLIIAKFPYLSKNSEFNPHENLANIYSWGRCINNLEEELSDSTSQNFQFWVWQNDCPVHGKSNRDAERNKKRLLHCNQDLKTLMQKQKEVSRRLLTACNEWLRNQGRELSVHVCWQPKKEMDYVIRLLQED